MIYLHLHGFKDAEQPRDERGRWKACANCGTVHAKKARWCKSCHAPQKYWRPLTEKEHTAREERRRTVEETFQSLLKSYNERHKDD